MKTIVVNVAPTEVQWAQFEALYRIYGYLYVETVGPRSAFDENGVPLWRRDPRWKFA